jgi:hypothetical protein
MWAALEAYQPKADADGHGDSWRVMCRERTEDAAWWAAYPAPKGSAAKAAAVAAARAKVAWAAAADRFAQEAIDAINRRDQVGGEAVSTQPEALRLADALESAVVYGDTDTQAADELRRQHAEIERLRGALREIVDEIQAHVVVARRSVSRSGQKVGY